MKLKSRVATKTIETMKVIKLQIIAVSMNLVPKSTIANTKAAAITDSARYDLRFAKRFTLKAYFPLEAAMPK